MKRSNIIHAGLLALVLMQGAVGAVATVRVLPDETVPLVFGNGQRLIRAHFHNSSGAPANVNLRYRLYQASGSTLMPLADAQAWKLLTLASDQIVLESLVVELRPVRAETVFHVVWFDGEKRLGSTPLIAFPEQLLKPLIGLAGQTRLGLLDLEGRFQAGLGSIPVEELRTAADIAGSEARLILIAPMAIEKRPVGLGAALKKKAASGSAVVWIQAPLRCHPEPLPDTYVVADGAGRVVIAAATTVQGLADSPRAQLNLLRLAELATGDKKLELPADSEP